MVKSINKMKPTAWINPSYFGSTFLPVISSKNRNTSLPPSSAGSGKRFITPRFMVIIAIKESKLLRPAIKLVFNPSEVASPIAEAIPIGPLIALRANLPVIRPIKLDHTILTVEMVSRKTWLKSVPNVFLIGST